jgi:hypothetical protein
MRKLIKAYPYRQARVTDYQGYPSNERGKNGNLCLITQRIKRAWLKDLEEDLVNLAEWQENDNHVVFVWEEDGRIYAGYFHDETVFVVTWGRNDTDHTGNHILPGNIEIWQ